MILNKARLVCLSFRCLAVFFRISCHHKVHWAHLIDSYVCGTWHGVVHVTIINEGLSKELCSLSYTSMDGIVKRIIQLGQGALLAKVNIK